MHIVGFQVHNTRCNTLTRLSKCTISSTDGFATTQINSALPSSSMMIAFFHVAAVHSSIFMCYCVVFCPLHFTSSHFSLFSLSLCACIELVRVCCCCCFRLYLFRNFVILCVCYFFVIPPWIRNQFLVHVVAFFSRCLYAIYSERGCICLCYAFNLYLRSLSMRCYSHLSLSVVYSVSVVGSVFFMRFASFSMACIALPEHSNASQLTHTHRKRARDKAFF